MEGALFAVEHQSDFKRDAFIELGGYDENLFIYCADVDLSWRAWLAAGTGHRCAGRISARGKPSHGKTPSSQLGTCTWNWNRHHGVCCLSVVP